MSKGLLLLNVLTLAVAASAAVFIVREIRQPLPTIGPSRARPANDGAPATRGNEAEPPKPAPGGYAAVASRNLFSPTRSEAPVVAAPVKPAAVLPRPNLFGVVVREGSSIAYLEDPTTKRVAGYRLGDTVAGGTVQTIDADHVVLARPEGQVDVQLRDPGRPRPAALPVPGQPAPPQPGAPATGVFQPGAPAQPQGIQQVPAFQAPQPQPSQGLQVPPRPGQAIQPAPPPQALQQPPTVPQASPSPGTVIPRLRRGPAGGRLGGGE
jgi:Type II secretion system protein C